MKRTLFLVALLMAGITLMAVPSLLSGSAQYSPTLSGTGSASKVPDWNLSDLQAEANPKDWTAIREANLADAATKYPADTYIEDDLAGPYHLLPQSVEEWYQWEAEGKFDSWVDGGVQ